MSQTDRLISLTALGIVMLYNELWNIVLFRWQNPFAGFLGVLAFLAPLLLYTSHLIACRANIGTPHAHLRPLGCSLRHPLVLCIMEIESPRT